MVTSLITDGEPLRRGSVTAQDWLESIWTRFTGVEGNLGDKGGVAMDR